MSVICHSKNFPGTIPGPHLKKGRKEIRGKEMKLCYNCNDRKHYSVLLQLIRQGSYLWKFISNLVKFAKNV